MKIKRTEMLKLSALCIGIAIFTPGLLWGANKDPFLPLISETTPLPIEISELSLEPKPLLQAILIGGKKKGAIINNHYLTEGDVIPENPDVKIISIEKGGVIAKHRLNEYQLKIWKFYPIIKDDKEQKKTR
ncbi:MAG: hypothetical protein WC338_03470 [Candidatus Ratteibacteria bacterium]|jgi:hypothetical protein